MREMDNETKQLFIEAYEELKSSWQKIAEISCGEFNCSSCPLFLINFLPCKADLK